MEACACPIRWSRCRGAPATSLETRCTDRYPVHGGPVPALAQPVSRLAARGSHLDHRRGAVHPVVEASPCGNAPALPIRWSRCEERQRRASRTLVPKGFRATVARAPRPSGGEFSMEFSNNRCGPGRAGCRESGCGAAWVRLRCRRVAWSVGDTTAPAGVSDRCWRVGSTRGVGRIP